MRSGGEDCFSAVGVDVDDVVAVELRSEIAKSLGGFTLVGCAERAVSGLIVFAGGDVF